MKTQQLTTDQKITGSYRTPDGKAQIDWSIEPKENGLEFTACGEFEGGSGQCIDAIAAAYPDDSTVQRITHVWSQCHLNGMNAGTPEQTREVERRRVLAEAQARTWPDAERYFYDKALTQYNWNGYACKFGHDSFYSWECAILKEAGLYEVILPVNSKATGGFPKEVWSQAQVIMARSCADKGGYMPQGLTSSQARNLSDLELAHYVGARGYRFGERWVYREIPAEILAEIKSWSASPQPCESLEEFKAKQFLAEHGLRMRISLSDTKPAPCDVAGHHYRVTLTRERTKGARLVFDFWGSQKDMEEGNDPTPADILSCVASDVHTPETFEDFCAEFGDDPDSIKAQQTFRRADRFARRLREFFTESEISAMDLTK